MVLCSVQIKENRMKSCKQEVDGVVVESTILGLSVGIIWILVNSNSS